MTNRTFCVIGVGLFIASCASGTPRKTVEAPARVTDSGGKKIPAPGARIKDSVPEKAAALRAADPNHLQVESDEERWGIDAARERRRVTDEHAGEERKKEKASKAIVPVGPGFGGVAAPPTPSLPSP